MLNTSDDSNVFYFFFFHFYTTTTNFCYIYELISIDDDYNTYSDILKQLFPLLSFRDFKSSIPTTPNRLPKKQTKIHAPVSMSFSSILINFENSNSS